MYDQWYLLFRCNKIFDIFIAPNPFLKKNLTAIGLFKDKCEQPLLVVGKAGSKIWV